MKLLVFVLFALTATSTVQAQEPNQQRHYVAIAAKPEAMPDCEKIDCEAHFQRTIEAIVARFGGLEGPVLRSATYEGAGRIGLVIAGTSHLGTVRSVLGLQKIEFRRVNEIVSPGQLGEGELPNDTKVLPTRNPEYGESVAVYRDGGIDGDRVVRARTGIDSLTSEPIVIIEFDREGRVQFAEFTVANIGKPFAIVFEGVVLTTPYINEVILGGQLQISGGFTQSEANDLASAISAGALPDRMMIVEERSLAP